MGTAGIPVLYQTAVAEVTWGIVTPTIPVLHLHCLPRGVRVIHQLSVQAIACPPSGDGPFVWSDEAVLVDTVEHLNVSE